MPFFTLRNSLRLLPRRKDRLPPPVWGSYAVAAAFYSAALPLYRDAGAVCSSR
jgi:hypothetical protein